MKWKQVLQRNFPARLPENRGETIVQRLALAARGLGLIGPVTLEPARTCEILKRGGTAQLLRMRAAAVLQTFGTSSLVFWSAERFAVRTVMAERIASRAAAQRAARLIAEQNAAISFL